MNWKKKHIAFLLIGLFTFPILFLSFHTVLHHQYEPGCEHNCSHAEHSSTPGENLVKDEASCLVCEYEFSINDLADISVHRIITPLVVRTIQEKEIQTYFPEVSSTKSPRAPPHLLA